MRVRTTCPDCGADLEVETNRFTGERQVRPADLVRMHKKSNDCEYELRKDEDK